MLRSLVAVALLIGCRGDQPARNADPKGSASSVSVMVPKLPQSPDGLAAVAAIDESIRTLRSDRELIPLLLERAQIRGQLADYLDALARSAHWIEAEPANVAAWKARALALSRIHRFAEARTAMQRVQALSDDPSDWEDLAAVLDEAAGHPELAAAQRERAAKLRPGPRTLTLWAATLALAGRFDEARALIPKAAATVRDNPASLLSWLTFQWGRIYELDGQLGAARQFYEEAHRRLPDSLDATVHLVEAMRATGQDPKAILDAALRGNPHPELLALAGKTSEAAAEWERYVAALPEAFADHAARFYLSPGVGPGHDPKRALELARGDLANRATIDARALVVEAALAAGDPTTACELAPALESGRRAHQFLAWRAFGACGRTAEADAVAARLGIH